MMYICNLYNLIQHLYFNFLKKQLYTHSSPSRNRSRKTRLWRFLQAISSESAKNRGKGVILSLWDWGDLAAKTVEAQSEDDSASPHW